MFRVAPHHEGGARSVEVAVRLVVELSEAACEQTNDFHSAAGNKCESSSNQSIMQLHLLFTTCCTIDWLDDVLV